MRPILLVAIAAFLFTSAGCDGRSVPQAFGIDSSITPSALRAAVADKRMNQFYELRGWRAAWSDEAVEQLQQAFAEAERHALDPGDFSRIDEKDPVRREIALTGAALRYADALADGLVNPRSLWDIYTVPRNRVDLLKGLNQAVEAGTIGGWLTSLAPADAEYRALSDAYVHYRQRGTQTPSVQVLPGRPIEPGKRDPRMPAIVAALRVQGYLVPPSEPPEGRSPAPPADATHYSPELVAAVARLQADYGIEADGVISSDTLEALNTGPKDRARILAVNLERRRWLERQPAATRIDVNTAAAFLHYWREGNRVEGARVVVGQPDWETPQIGSPLLRLIANPPWTVPDSIAEEEIIPKGAGYMARNNMRYQNGRIVQSPGPDSALGLVKLDLDNPHAIYLHDTPAKALFAEEDRHASHGCVRVQNAVGFARLIALDQNVLPAFDEALASGKETRVELPRPIPVRLLYHSAYLENGRVVFRPDPYGWDDRLAQALGLGTHVRQRVQRRAPADIGP